MLSAICLMWIGLQLNAPAWYYVILVIVFIISFINFGRGMYKAGKDS